MIVGNPKTNKLWLAFKAAISYVIPLRIVAVIHQDLVAAQDGPQDEGMPLPSMGGPKGRLHN